MIVRQYSYTPVRGIFISLQDSIGEKVLDLKSYIARQWKGCA